MTAQADHEEVKVAKTMGQLVDIAEVEMVFTEAMTMVATQLDGLAGRVAGDLAGMNDPAGIRQTLMVETRRIRRAAAGKLEQYIENGADR